jgi:hypothetical protein
MNESEIIKEQTEKAKSQLTSAMLVGVMLKTYMSFLRVTGPTGSFKPIESAYRSMLTVIGKEDIEDIDLKEVSNAAASLILDIAAKKYPEKFENYQDPKDILEMKDPIEFFEIVKEALDQSEAEDPFSVAVRGIITAGGRILAYLVPLKSKAYRMDENVQDKLNFYGKEYSRLCYAEEIIQNAIEQLEVKINVLSQFENNERTESKS